jgi:hypothetical protein
MLFLPTMVSPRKKGAAWARAACATFTAALLVATPALLMPTFLIIAAPQARAQVARLPAQPAGDPAAALAAALSAACRQDHAAFSTHLTTENSAAFRALPEPQQAALLKRFILLDDPGRPLLSTVAGGRTEVRCEAAGLVADMHLGAPEVHENLAFVTAEIGQPGEQPRSVRIGFVREGGDWKLLSVGLLLLDLPSLAKQWEDADLQANENDAIAALAKIAEALDKYQQAYGKLPETLEPLGPPAPDGASPEHAGLLAGELATGASGGYNFRYVIMAATTGVDDSDRDRAAGFALAATPIEYGKGGRRSFYLDSNGTLRGDDKHGAVATATDPRILTDAP